MVKHIVLFEFKDENKNKNIQKVKESLESLKDKIEVLQDIEVGINFDKTQRAMDMSIYASFNSKEDLIIYANDKEHLKVVEFIKSVTISSKVVDYSLLS